MQSKEMGKSCQWQYVIHVPWGQRKRQRVKKSADLLFDIEGSQKVCKIVHICFCLLCNGKRRRSREFSFFFSKERNHIKSYKKDDEIKFLRPIYFM